MSRLTRQEMKRDEVREVLSRTLVFLSENAKPIAIGLGVVAALIVGGTLISGRIGGRQDDASDALAKAMKVSTAPLTAELTQGVSPKGEVFATSEERSLEAKRRFEQIIDEFPRSSSARIARAYVAQLDWEMGQPEAAREIWSDLAGRGADDLVRVQAMLNLLATDRIEGRAAEAEEMLLGLLDDPKSVLPQARVLYELGLTQEALGKPDESRTSYQRLVDEHPTSPFARTAATKLSPV